MNVRTKLQGNTSNISKDILLKSCAVTFAIKMVSLGIDPEYVFTCFLQIPVNKTTWLSFPCNKNSTLSLPMDPSHLVNALVFQY